MIIDAHQHFWHVERADYGWLTPDAGPLYRDFLPDDLAPLLRQTGIGGTILVQAAPTLAETEFLLDLAGKTSFILGVVGWVDFAASSAADDIARLAHYPKLVGLRPMIQDIADDDWMLLAEFAPVYEAMVQHDLTFDALVMPRHLQHLRVLLARHPDLRTVIDHGAKPAIGSGCFDIWATEMSAVAQETSAYCKLSGLLTEAGDGWTRRDVAPYAAHLLGAFGADRLVWGSDWPVLNVASDYRTWFALAQSFVPEGDARDAIFGKTALDLYKLNPP